MKKTYQLTHPKIKLARLIDAAKYDAKKYMRRERNKKLPEGANFWSFECKYGATENEAEVIHVSKINKNIDLALKHKLESFYLEIIAVPGFREKKQPSE